MSDAPLIEQKLRAWCVDWNGAQMVRGEPPRDGIHCDDLLDAADAIARAEAEVLRLRAILREFATQHPPIDPRTDRRMTFKQWVRGTADGVLREATPASPPPARQGG